MYFDKYILEYIQNNVSCFIRTSFMNLTKVKVTSSLLCILLVMNYAAEDFREHLETAFEVMMTQTMSYLHIIGEKGRTKERVSQIREADGTVKQRREECSFVEKVRDVSILGKGEYVVNTFYTDEGMTQVYFTKERKYAVRMNETIPASVIHDGAVFSGRETVVDGQKCWVIRQEFQAKNGKTYFDDYTVSQSSHVILGNKMLDPQGRLLSTYANKDFSFNASFGKDFFQLPLDMDLKFASDYRDFEKIREGIFKTIAAKIDSVQKTNVKPNLLTRIRQNPMRFLTQCVVLLGSSIGIICFVTVGILKIRRKKGEE